MVTYFLFIKFCFKVFFIFLLSIYYFKSNTFKKIALKAALTIKSALNFK